MKVHLRVVDWRSQARSKEKKVNDITVCCLRIQESLKFSSKLIFRCVIFFAFRKKVNFESPI